VADSCEHGNEPIGFSRCTVPNGKGTKLLNKEEDVS